MIKELTENQINYLIDNDINILLLLLNNKYYPLKLLKYKKFLGK